MLTPIHLYHFRYKLKKFLSSPSISLFNIIVSLIKGGTRNFVKEGPKKKNFKKLSKKKHNNQIIEAMLGVLSLS